MPGVDFQSYLLSASPPGFDIHYAVRNHFNASDIKSPRNTQVITVSRNNTSTQAQGFSMLEKKVEKLKLVSSSRSSSPIIELEKDFKTPKSPDKMKKKVSFADDLGHQLEYIRILTDSSDSPPCFRHNLVSSLQRKGSDEMLGLPPLKLTFAQPASEYAAFRDKLEHNCVSLENVILKDYNLVGTIKVKNLAFHKTVKVRYTLDDWNSFKDIIASYVHSHKSSMTYDTFSFELKLQEFKDPNGALQFAIMYEAEGQQYWDNNSGDNYEVIPSSRKEEMESTYNTTDRVVFGLHTTTSWPQFCSWSYMDKSVPYW